MWHRQLTVTRLDPNAGAYRYSLGLEWTIVSGEGWACFILARNKFVALE